MARSVLINAQFDATVLSMKATIETQQLSIFAAVVRYGGFTAAARMLDTDKGYVSRTIARLEDQMGVRLLDRSTRRVSPTAAGTEFFETCTAVLSTLAEAEAAARSRDAQPTGVLRVSLAPEFGRQRANAWFAELLKTYPNLDLDVRYTNSVPGLDEGMIDVAVRLGRIEESSKIITRVGSIHYGLYAAPGYLTGRPRVRVPADLQQHQLLVFQPRGVTEATNPRTGSGLEARWRFERDGSVAEVQAQARYRANNVFATRQMCAAGLGVAVLPVEVAELVEPPATEKVALKRLLPDWGLESTPVNFEFFPAGKADPRIRALIQIARRKPV